MNLLDALRTIEDHIRSGMAVECWMLGNGQMMRRVMFNDGETYASNVVEFETAILAIESIAHMPVTIDDHMDKVRAAAAIGESGHE